MYTYNNLTFRLLDKSENPQILDLHRSKDVLSKVPLSPEEKIRYLGRIESILSVPECITAGAFDGNKLVAVESGRYFKDFPYWYAHGKVFNLGLPGLSAINHFPEIHYRLMHCMFDYFEPIGYYAYYATKEIGECIAMQTVNARMFKKGILTEKYDHFWEEIYLPGETIKNKNHSFYLRPGFSFENTMVVVMSSLKPEFRKEILFKKYRL